MKSKGISPLIAAVLLIAFTMAVASIFAQWAPSLIQEAQGETRDKTTEVRNCSGIVVDITSANSTHMTVKQVAGDSPVGDFTATWYFSDGADPVQNRTDLTGFNRNTTSIYNGNTGGSSLDEAQAVPENCEGAPSAVYNP